MGRRPLVGMVLGWLAVVLVVMGITFVVVDRAGRGVGPASAAGSLASVAPPSSGSTGSTSPSRPTTPSSPSSTPSGRPMRTAEPTPTTRRTTSAPEPTPPRIDTNTASFTTEGGTVVASCRASSLFLDSIRPRDGWRFEKESEHGGLEVAFKSAEREVKILLTCVRGVPTRTES